MYTVISPTARGAENTGLRILRSTASKNTLRLVLEGRGGRSYTLYLRTPRRVGDVPGVKLTPRRGGDMEATVVFEGPAGGYVRREIVLPLGPR